LEAHRSIASLILTIDTTREWGSLALQGDHLGAEVSMHAPLGFSGVLFAEIEQLLARCQVAMHQIDCFAAAVGPGTFTGVRVGMACAMGLAEAMGKPACGVSNLEALAEFGTGLSRAVTIDARRGDIYAAVYGPEGAVIVPERVCTPEEFRASLPPGEIEWINCDGPLAAAIAKVARRKKWVDPALIEANYLRRTDAELNLHLPR
jgi:tRNA threonylcarbamoyladenosine biosynthesis protein TsaB